MLTASREREAHPLHPLHTLLKRRVYPLRTAQLISRIDIFLLRPFVPSCPEVRTDPANAVSVLHVLLANFRNADHESVTRFVPNNFGLERRYWWTKTMSGVMESMR